MRAPDIEALETGLDSSALDKGRSGRIYADALALELGLLSVDAEVPSREGNGPKDRRLIPDVDSLATCFVAAGVWSSCTNGAGMEFEDVVDPVVRFRLRIVTLLGIPACPKALVPFLGLDLGGVLTGAGSLLLADCTLCSSRCICAVSVRICVSEVEFGKPLVAVGGGLDLAPRITPEVPLRFLEAGVGAGIGGRDVWEARRELDA